MLRKSQKEKGIKEQKIGIEQTIEIEQKNIPKKQQNRQKE